MGPYRKFRMKGLVRYLLCLGLLATVSSCTSPPMGGGAGPTGCPGGSAGPSVRYGSLDLSPTVGVVTTSLIVPKTLYAKAPPPVLQLDPGGPMMSVFEICVVTNPPARNTHLGVDVMGVMEDPPPAAAGSGPFNFWQNVLWTYFVRPLQDNQTDANGVLKIDVTASSLYNAISNPPPGHSSGRALITIILSDGPHKLDLTVALL